MRISDWSSDVCSSDITTMATPMPDATIQEGDARPEPGCVAANDAPRVADGYSGLRERQSVTRRQQSYTIGGLAFAGMAKDESAMMKEDRRPCAILISLSA